MKAVIIKDLNGKPLYIAKVEDLTDLDFLKVKKQCEKNITELNEEKAEEFAKVYHEIECINDDIKILKGE